MQEIMIALIECIPGNGFVYEMYESQGADNVEGVVARDKVVVIAYNFPSRVAQCAWISAESIWDWIGFEAIERNTNKEGIWALIDSGMYDERLLDLMSYIIKNRKKIELGDNQIDYPIWERCGY